MKSLMIFPRTLRWRLLPVLVAAFALPAEASNTPVLERSAGAALSKLYARNSRAIEIGRNAVAALVFPDIHMLGAGLSIQTATGVLYYKNVPKAYFNLSGCSVGLELGIQKYDMIVFFEDGAALDKLYQAGGFEFGTAPSLVIGDCMFAGKLSSSSLRKGIDIFLSGHFGFMASIGVGKNKFTEYVPGD